LSVIGSGVDCEVECLGENGYSCRCVCSDYCYRAGDDMCRRVCRDVREDCDVDVVEECLYLLKALQGGAYDQRLRCGWSSLTGNHCEYDSVESGFDILVNC